VVGERRITLSPIPPLHDEKPAIEIATRIAAAPAQTCAAHANLSIWGNAFNLALG
jgi:hypothetical protein